MAISSEAFLQVAKALHRNRFKVQLLENGSKAKEVILAAIPDGAVVSAGGSLTIRQLDLLTELRHREYKIIEHWLPGLTAEEDLALRREELGADVFLTSVNAVTREGHLVLTDGVGNRVAATIFGPPKVLVVVGRQKIVADYPAARERIRAISPANNRRLGLDLPCVAIGECQDCRTSGRSCNATLILEAPPLRTDLKIFLVDEELGL